MTQTRTIVRRGYEVGQDTDFAREMADSAERFAKMRGVPRSLLGRLAQSVTKSSSRLDYSAPSLGEVDDVLSSMPEGVRTDFSLAPILTGGMERLEAAAMAYFGEVIRRCSKRGYQWADLGVWDDDYALSRWGEGVPPPMANLMSADGGHILMLHDCVVDKLVAGWSPIAEAVRRHADFDEFVMDWVGSHLVVTSG